MSRGKFITFEGIEGSGKSSHSRWLATELAAYGVNAWLTAEPWNPTLRSMVLTGGAISNEAELLLFLADRALHVGQIRKQLDEGVWVICDRYSDSTIVYQGYARGMGIDRVRELCRFAECDLRPDMTLLLDLSVEEGLRRQRERNRIGDETVYFHQRVRDGFLAEAEREPERYRIVDTTASPTAVRVMLWALVEQLMHANGG